MKILDAGDHPLSNADVLDWIHRKRAQHAAEDAADKKLHHNKPTPRPKNFLTALTRTERELASSKYYPYTANPATYAGGAKNREEKFRAFVLELENVLEGEVGEAKCLSEMELLMVFNLAPGCVEMLQPMIEGVEERFTAEEQGLLVEVVLRMLRGDEEEQQRKGGAGE